MKRELLPKMVKIFEDLDADKSGELTFEELLDAPQSVKDEMNVLIEVEDLGELFDIMDEDGTGTVSMEEFFECLTKMAISNVPIDQLRVLKKIDRCIRSE